MKKLIYLAALLLMPWTASAQEKSSKITLTPRVGMTVSDFACSLVHELYTPKTGFTVGVDAEYRISKLFGVSAGVFYNMQGAKEHAALYIPLLPPSGNPDIIYTSPSDFPSMTSVIGKGAHIDFDRNGYDYYYMYEPKVELHYLSIPILAQAHVWKGLTVKLGVQWDHLVSARAKGQKESKLDGTISYGTFDMGIKSQFHNDALAIPVGVAYSYKNIELDARYLWGITKIAANADNDDKDVMNSTFAITLGYNFHL
ncbi:MAG: PorT family protein [Prevotella sp.]|nr:PorT family protein [Prevotella sp.]